MQVLLFDRSYPLGPKQPSTEAYSSERAAVKAKQFYKKRLHVQ